MEDSYAVIYYCIRLRGSRPHKPSSFRPAIVVTEMSLGHTFVRPLLTLALLFTLLNAHKPLCIDDTLYDYNARQIAEPPAPSRRCGGLSCRQTGTPAIVSEPPKFVCTSTPTV